MHVVPVLDLDETLELGAIAHRPDIGGLLAIGYVIKLAAKRQETAGALLVNLAGVRLPGIDIELVALHDPFGDIGPLQAAVLDAAVSGVRPGAPVLQLEFEVGG